MHIGSDEIMISFDVSSLFTNVPIEEAIEVIHGMLHDDNSIITWQNVGDLFKVDVFLLQR